MYRNTGDPHDALDERDSAPDARRKAYVRIRSSPAKATRYR